MVETGLSAGSPMSVPVATSLFALDGANGLKLAADTWPDSISKMASAGDINGDGFDDVIMSADFYSHTSYVLFGSAAGFPAVLSTDALNGINGFSMEGTGT